MTGRTTNLGEQRYLRTAVGYYLSGQPTYEIGLYSNNYTTTESTILTDLTEVTGGGYARKTLTPASYTVTAGTPTRATFPNLTWTFSAAVGNVYGYFIRDTVSGVLSVVETFASPVVIDAAGKSVILTHTVELRDVLDKNGGTGFIMSNAGEAYLLEVMLGKRPMNGKFLLRLYISNVANPPSETSVLQDFGSLITVAEVFGATQFGSNLTEALDTDANETALMQYTVGAYLEWTSGSSGNTAYGYVLVSEDGQYYIGGEAFAAPIPISAGDKFRSTPRWKFSDDADR